MSSDYRLICLTHDPALEVGGCHWQQLESALAAVADSAADPLLACHVGCDLLIGRYSYPLVEVICPPQTAPTSVGWHSHRDPKRIDVAWLRLLGHAVAATESEAAVAACDVPQCWRWDRVYRLSHALDLVDNRCWRLTCCADCDKAGE